MSGEEDENVLKAQGMRVCSRTGLLICTYKESVPTPCAGSVRVDRKAVWTHVSKFHNGEKKVALSLFRAAKRLSERSITCPDLKKKYEDGGSQHGQLPFIDGLPSHWGKKCPFCDRIFTETETIRKHVRTMHKKKLCVQDIGKLPSTVCQSLGRNTSARFFPVRSEQLVSEREYEYDPGHCVVGNEFGMDDKFKSAFVYQAKSEERLSTCGLTLDTATLLMSCGTSWSSIDIDNRVQAAGHVLVYQFKEAAELVRSAKVLHSVLMSIATSGAFEKKKPFKFLNITDREGLSGTAGRYARSVQTVLRIACVAVTRKRDLPDLAVSEKVEKAVLRFLSCEIDSENVVFKDSMFFVLWEIFNEVVTYTEKKNLSFAFFVAACLCTTDVGGGSARFATGKIVGSKVSGILYCVSCYYVLHIFKYTPESKRDDALDEVEKVTRPGARVGARVFTDLRSICATVRDQEMNLTFYQQCSIHPICGFIGGQEFSAAEIGQAVRNAQDLIKKKMFVGLLRNKTLPLNFRQNIERMADNMEKETVGYWALADERNSAIVKQCVSWTLSNAINLKSLYEDGWKSWRAEAEEVLKYILTAMHLCGGGPSRGTEIAALTLRNTPYSRRTVYFVGEEIMIVPVHSKTRSMKQCNNMLFITRHIDKETSFLIKAFFLLIHPVLVKDIEFKRDASGTDMLSNVSLNAIRDQLTLGMIEGQYMARVLGAKLSQLGVPFTFSQYRHLQRGMMKALAKDSEMWKLFAEEQKQEGDDEEAAVSLEQGGHSERTAHVFYAQPGAPNSLVLQTESAKINLFRSVSRAWHKYLGLDVCNEASWKENLSAEKSDVSTRNTRSEKMGDLEQAVDSAVTKALQRLEQGSPKQRNTSAQRRRGAECKSPGVALNEYGQHSDLSVRKSRCVTPETIALFENGCELDEEISLLGSFPETSGSASTAKEVQMCPESKAKLSCSNLEGPRTNVLAQTLSSKGVITEPALQDCKRPLSSELSKEHGSPDELFTGLGRRTAVGGVRVSNPVFSSDGSLRDPKSKNDDIVDWDAQKIAGRQTMSLNKRSEAPHSFCHRPAKRNQGFSAETNSERQSGSATPCVTNLDRSEGACMNAKTSIEGPGEQTKSAAIRDPWERFRSTNRRRINEMSAKQAMHSEVQRTEDNVVEKRAIVSKAIRVVKQRTDEKMYGSSGRATENQKRNQLLMVYDEFQNDPSADICPKSRYESRHQDATSRYTAGCENERHDLKDCGIVSGSLSAPCDSNLPFQRKVDSFTCNYALERVTKKPGACFKSAAQQIAMEAVASRRSDLLVALRTGEGKTAVAMGPILFEDGVTIWVSPLRALLWETEKRLRKGNITVFRLDTFHVDQYMRGCVLLISPEDVGRGMYAGILKALVSRKKVNRIVIDEAHLAVMAESYRPCFAQLKMASNLGTACPVVLLTATAPVSMISRIATACGASPRSLEVVRGDPCRSNLSLEVHHLKQEGLQELSNEVLRSISNADSQGRCIVICLTIDNAAYLRDEIVGTGQVEDDRVFLYHSKVGSSCREQTMKRWSAGKSRGVMVMVATEGFSTGTDAADVRLVIFAGGARNILDYWQGAGRAGRDGKPAKVVVLYHSSHLRRASSSEKKEGDAIIEGTGDFKEWAEANTMCRRAGVERVICSPNGEPKTCKERSSVALCDVCGNSSGGVSFSEVIQEEMKFELCHREQPKAQSIILDARRREAVLLHLTKGIQWMRDVSQCIHNMESEVILQTFRAKKPCGTVLVSGIRRSTRRLVDKGVRCNRCFQRNHFASKCPNIDSVKSGGERRCRYCFLISVGGADIHRGGDFGNAGCRLANVTKLVLCAWSRVDIRDAMLSEDSGLHWGAGEKKPKTDREFADWLIKETGSKNAGVLKALRWIQSRLGVLLDRRSP